METKTQNRESGLDEWEVVCRFLPQGWQGAAVTLGAFQRSRRIPDPALLLRILLIHLAEGCSLQETCTRVSAAGWCLITKTALFKRLIAAAEWLRWMAEQLWRQTPRPAVRSSYRIRAVDATVVREPGSSGALWRIHYVINLSTLQCDHFELTDVKGGETLRRIPVAPGDLVLGDRAYGTTTGVARVVRDRGQVLVRINLRSLPLYTPQGRRISILNRLRSLRVGQTGDWPTRVHGPNGPIAGRLVAIKLGRRAARKTVDRVRRKANRQQRAVGPTTLEAAQYVFVWTTVPADRHSAAAILELYRLRWQIELVFKRMKSIMGLGELPKTTADSSRAWIQGKLLTAMLLERILREAESFSPWGYRLESPPQSMA